MADLETDLHARIIHILTDTRYCTVILFSLMLLHEYCLFGADYFSIHLVVYEVLWKCLYGSLDSFVQADLE